MDKKFSLIIHGGAGSWEKHSEIKSEKLLKICKVGEKILKKGGSSLEAVEKVIIEMENDPLFNAGVGSSLSLNGNIEMDASIMMGNINSNKTKSGAITNIKNTKNPISIAKEVMLNCEYSILSGEGADQFSEYLNKSYNWKKLITKERKNIRDKIIEKIKLDKKIKYPKIKKLIQKNPEIFFGTVGAVAFDGETIVAGTSTGGYPYKAFGRVGDSAIIGSGTIANENCGISVSGFGEYSIEVNLANTISTHYEISKSFKKAINFGINKINKKYGINNTALIAINKKGNFEIAHNTKKFGFAKCSNDEKSKVLIYLNT